MSSPVFDCVVVGGGPAGLSAAVNMARMKRSVLVVDDRDGRSLWGQTNRNYLGFPDGIPAADIRLAGRRQAARYGVEFVYGRVRAAELSAGDADDTGAGDGAARRFRLVLEPCAGPAEGDAAGQPGNRVRDVEVGHALGEHDVAKSSEVIGRTIVIATGVRDCFPEFDGWETCVGRSLFWCINCDGYETQGHRVAVVGADEDAAETALQLLEFTADVTLVAGTNDGFEISGARIAEIEAQGITTHAAAVARYQNRDGAISGIVLGDRSATRLDVDMVFQYHRPVARADVAILLGVELDAIGQIMVDGSQQTNVAGVYAAGDVTHPHNHAISAAVHEGNEAACAANYYLYRPVQKSPSDAGVTAHR